MEKELIKVSTGYKVKYKPDWELTDEFFDGLAIETYIVKVDSYSSEMKNAIFKFFKKQSYVWENVIEVKLLENHIKFAAVKRVLFEY